MKVLCDCCGKIMDIFDRQNCPDIHKKLGFGSKYDGLSLNLTLCSNCIDKIIESCVISPISTKVI